MKKGIIAVVIITVSCLQVHAQFIGAVSAPVLEAIGNNEALQNTARYAQMFKNDIESIFHAYTQVQTAIRMEEMAMRNLRKMSDIKSFEDFMNWYNRQLYLEKAAEEKLLGTKVSFGGEPISLKDVKNIPNALEKGGQNFAWKDEFTPEQKQAMWTNLGLTSENYAYVKTWAAREDYLLDKFISKTEIQNEENMADLSRMNEMQNQLAGDNLKPDNDKMGEKEIAAMQAEELGIIIKQLATMNMTMAELQELMAVNNLQDKTPNRTVAFSAAAWEEDTFLPLE